MFVRNFALFYPRFIVFFLIFRRFYIAGQLFIAYFCNHITVGMSKPHFDIPS